MAFEIDQFWEDADAPVLKRFLSFDERLQVCIAKRLSIFERFTADDLVKTKKLEKIKHTPQDIYELRVVKGKDQVRILGVLDEERFTALHIIKKKTQRLSKKDITTALKRLP